MTRDKKRKRAVHDAKQATGRRYTPLARELDGPVAPGGGGCTLAGLLAECATLAPSVPSADLLYDPPRRFASRLLGVELPYSAVLTLAGLLAHEGIGVALGVESVHPGEVAVLVCGGRRFEVVLSQDHWVAELCREPGCGDGPAAGLTVTWCSDHLTGRESDVLVSVARSWASDRQQEVDWDPERCGGAATADTLVKAAAACGCSRAVIDTLLLYGFPDPDALAEGTWDEEVPMRARHAIERERLRLSTVADAEVRRIRREMKCARCGEELFPLSAWAVSYRAEFCSAECDSLAAAAAGPADAGAPVPVAKSVSPWPEPSGI
ncbi:hypothetical protein AB0C76_33100 [Kitasatospora sp. NPDC048722]|uniref:hypothetical protein n=1 Tax=Kitasatospora sp. NPDC048722 TaxID=3155639 RepID=UPI0033EA3B96